MNLYRYFEAKKQNKKTTQLIRSLVEDGRIVNLPNSIGRHYRRYDPSSPDFNAKYALEVNKDKPIIQLLTCSNELEVQMAYNGDVNILGVHHCGNQALCACCGTRQARRVASQLRYSLLKLHKFNYKYFMLTLTLPNCFDGFRTEFDIYNRCLNELLSFCGWYRHKDGACKGAFGSKELTWSKDKGFHPHIHLILAYDPDSISDLKYTRKGQVKSMSLGDKVISTLSIRDKFVSLIEKKFPLYYKENSEKLKDANIDFQPISSEDDLCDEICKYFIDYNSFRDADTLFFYMRDIFRVQKYSKLGCFGWNSDLEEEWLEWCKQGKPVEQNAHFIQFVRSKNPDLVYFGNRYGLDSNGCVVSVPFFYSRDELIYNGDSLYLSFDHKSGCYLGQIYNKHVKRLYDIHVSMYDAFRLMKSPRSDVSEFISSLPSSILRFCISTP